MHSTHYCTMLEPFLWMAALGMGLLLAYTLAYVSDTDGALEVYLSIFVLGMMVAMLVGAIIYIAHPSTASIQTAIWLNMAAMGFLTLPIIRVIVKTALEKGELQLYVYTIPYRYLWLMRTLIIVLVLLNELLMGWAFISITSGTPLFAVGGGNILRAFSSIVGSDWFVFIMAVEMLFSAYLIRKLAPRSFMWVVLFQAGTMVFSPTAIQSPLWRSLSLVADSLVMAGFVAYVIAKLYRDRQVNRNFANYLYALVYIYSAMVPGILLWALASSELLLAIALVAQMALYFRVELEPSILTAKEKRSWLLDAKLIFQ